MDRSENMSAINDWMIDLLEDDRPIERDTELRLSDGLHWMYRAALVRSN